MTLCGRDRRGLAAWALACAVLLGAALPSAAFFSEGPSLPPERSLSRTDAEEMPAVAPDRPQIRPPFLVASGDRPVLGEREWTPPTRPSGRVGESLIVARISSKYVAYRVTLGVP